MYVLKHCHNIIIIEVLGKTLTENLMTNPTISPNSVQMIKLSDTQTATIQSCTVIEKNKKASVFQSNEAYHLSDQIYEPKLFKCFHSLCKVNQSIKIILTLF